MTKIVDYEFDGIPLKVPEQSVQFYEKYSYKTFPTNFCGAGNGLGQIIVPDRIFGLTRFLKFIGLDFSIKISPACKAHDDDWFYADPTWTAFYQSNDRFEENIESIIDKKARNKWVKSLAMYRKVTYENAVTLHGKNVFWSIKAEQGYDIQESAKRYIDSETILLMREHLKNRGQL